MITHT